VRLPALFVHGSEDPVVPVTHARAWSSRLARARLAEFAGARHDVLNETAHREVAAAITEFVLTAGAASAGARSAVSGHSLPRRSQHADRWRAGSAAFAYSPDQKRTT
jgi:hypothetical protein